MDILLDVFGGLGLFFIGVKMIGAHLKRMTGRRFRAVIARSTRNPVSAGALGVVAGAVAQSTSAVTFVVVSLVSAGLVEVRRAVPLVVWANVGTAALVMLATLNLHAMVLGLLGIVGVATYAGMDKAPRLRDPLGALLGVGLLFLGLGLIKAGAAPLRDMEMAREFIAFAAESWFIAFLLGALLTLVAQSSATVSVVAVALVGIGLLEMQQTMMIITGAGLGSGLSVWFMGANLRGLARRLVTLQLANKVLGAAVLTTLFLAEAVGGVPLVLALVERLAADPAGQAAWVFLIFQVVAAAGVTLVQGPLLAAIERRAPASTEETLSRPHFLHEEALAEPATALDLAGREADRLVDLVAATLDNVRADADPATLVHYDTLTEAGRTLQRTIGGFLTEVIEGGVGHRALEDAIRARTRLSLLGDLRETVTGLVAALDRGQVSPALAGLTHGVVESLHFAVRLLAEESRADDGHGLPMLLALTADRGDMMDRARRAATAGEATLSRDEQDVLYTVTTLFERAIWLVRRTAMLAEGAQPAEGAAPARIPAVAEG
ncbi:Na/Pi cotransporter family protein [Novispirillum sp. DQ9]|uniref:Na/Pi cotransporter family protein n=1 Tax=Novispirillum sp. DQ9 TaxID=3398612 RepID=UPI003C79AAB1